MNPTRGSIVAAASAAGLAAVLLGHAATASGPKAALSAGAGAGLGGGATGPSPTTSVPAGGGSGTTTVPPTGTRTATGPVEQYGYGQLAVSVTVSGSHIVRTTVTQLQTAESYSQQLAQQVIPMLNSEIISAQSAQISAISGATYTSQGYAVSVQSALDKLGVK